MAATVYGRAVSQYVSDTTSDLFIRDVSEFPKLIKRTDFPLFTSIPQGKAPSQPKLKLEWGIRHIPPVNDTITTGGNSAAVTITPANIGYYQVGHVLQHPSGERTIVTAVGASDLTIVRAQGGSSAATIANASGVRIIGIAVKENAESPIGTFTQGEVDYNYFQIFDKLHQVSFRADKTPTYEIKGSRMQAWLKTTLQVEMPQYMENTLLWGGRAIGSTTVASTMGGVFQSSFIGNSVDVSDILTEYSFLNGLQLGYNAVGVANMSKRVMSHPFYKRIAANWYKDIRRVDTGENTIDMRVNRFETDFGTVEWMMNHHMRSINDPTLADGRILVYDPEDYELIPYADGAQWAEWDVYVGGMYYRRAVRGDYTLKAINPERRVAFLNVSATAGDYPNFVEP